MHKIVSLFFVSLFGMSSLLAQEKAEFEQLKLLFVKHTRQNLMAPSPRFQMEVDLDRDGDKDLAAIFEYVSEEEGAPEDAPLQNRWLVMAFKNKDGYELKLCEQIIDCPACGGTFGDPLMDFTATEEGICTVSYYGGSWDRWSKGFSFQYQAGDFLLLEDSEGRFPYSHMLEKTETRHLNTGMVDLLYNDNALTNGDLPIPEGLAYWELQSAYATSAPKADGLNGDDAIWKTAPSYLVPNEAEPTSVDGQMQVAALRDDQNLYLRFVVTDNQLKSYSPKMSVDTLDRLALWWDLKGDWYIETQDDSDPSPAESAYLRQRPDNGVLGFYLAPQANSDNLHLSWIYPDKKTDSDGMLAKYSKSKTQLFVEVQIPFSTFKKWDLCQGGCFNPSTWLHCTFAYHDVDRGGPEKITATSKLIPGNPLTFGLLKLFVENKPLNVLEYLGAKM